MKLFIGYNAVVFFWFFSNECSVVLAFGKPVFESKDTVERGKNDFFKSDWRDVHFAQVCNFLLGWDGP